jgi:hypothetical protein
VSLYFALEMASPTTECAVWAIDIDWLQQSTDQAMREFDPGSPDVLDLKTRNEYLNTLLLRDDDASIVGVVNPLRLNDRIPAREIAFHLP